MSVVLYSTHCPRCNVLEKKLQQKNISYEEVNDVDIMEEKGYLSVPNSSCNLLYCVVKFLFSLILMFK